MNKREYAQRVIGCTNRLHTIALAILCNEQDCYDALRQIPVQYRLPLVLHHVEGYRVAECAQMLALPKSTVKWRIHQGKRPLRRYWERRR